MNTEVDRYAVMGNPIGHSKSPLIHAQFAEQTGQSLHYEAMLIALDGFEQAVKAFRDQGGKGLNITVPFKQEAWALAEHRSPAAELAGAVNTLSLDGEQIKGDNTDGTGLVRDLTQNHDVQLANANILVVGAGGAVRGVLQPLLEQHPARVVIANRTVSKAEELAELFSSFGDIHACGFDDLDTNVFNLIINGTAASLHGKVPAIPARCIGEQTAVYDMMYGTEPTAFMQWAEQHGAVHCMDGLGMLVEQAAESFYIWRGIRPETNSVIEKLRTDL